MSACRSSIMLGAHLATKEMEQVVKNLYSLDNPWVPLLFYRKDLRPWEANNYRD